MSESLPNLTRNNILHDQFGKTNQALSDTHIPKSITDLEEIDSLVKQLDESKQDNRYKKATISRTASLSSISSFSCISESSSSLELASSIDLLSETSIDNDEPKSTANTAAKELKPGHPKKARLWSYIKAPLKIFRRSQVLTVDDTESDLPIYVNWIESNYSIGNSKLIKKLTNLHMMLSDPEVGITKTSKSSFSGDELFKWILVNFESNETDFVSFLGNQSEHDEKDAITICNVLFLMGLIVSLDKSDTKFMLNNSSYLLQAPYFIPLPTGLPSDFDYARYLIRRGNSNKFKLQDYELRALEEYKKVMKSSWKELEDLAQKDTAAFRLRSSQEIKIFKLQQQAFWRVYRPDPNSSDFLNLGGNIRKQRKVQRPLKGVMKQTRLKMRKACKYAKDYCKAVSNVDPFLDVKSELNPWISGDTTMWESELPISDSQIRLWTTGIYYLLHDSRGVQDFHQYLKNEFSQENLNFIIACRDLETKVSLKEFSALAKQIFRDFIMTGSPFEVNIAASIRKKIIAVIESCIANENDLERKDYEIYSDAVAHIMTLLEKDPYKRYCKLLKSQISACSKSSRQQLFSSGSGSLV